MKGRRQLRPLRQIRYSNCCGLLLAALLLVLGACRAPTPPPSPTPFPSPTPIATTMNTATPASSASTPEPTDATASPQPAATRAITTITVWESLPEAQAQLLAQDIQEFQEEFPLHRVDLRHYESSETFMTPLTAGQISFDIVLAAPPLLGNLQAAEKIAPVADFFPPSFMDEFAATTLAGATRAGDTWGIPDTAGFHLLLFYNKALIDTPPANTAELNELAASVTGGSQWGLGVNSYDPLWLLPWLPPFGGWLVDETGQPTLDSPAMVAALDLFAAWHQGSPVIAASQTYDEMRANFLSGKIALMIDGDWAIEELGQAQQLEWGVALLPAVSETEENPAAAPLVLGRYWAISPAAASGDRALAATRFLEFMTRPERQLAWTQQFGLLPTRREALGDPFIANDPVLRVSARQMQSGRTVPLGTNTNLLLDAMRTPLQDLLAGTLTSEEAAKLMQMNVER